jgi:hypothetical protein
LVCLTNLLTKYPPMPPKLNRKRALFVLTKIDEILAWEKRVEADRDTCFVELGRYLCEVRVGQYWRVEGLASFDDFLGRRFPESRRKAYYLMSIHEHLPQQVRKDLKEIVVGRKEGSWRRSRAATVRPSIVHLGCTKSAPCRGKYSDVKWRGNSREGKRSRPS